MCNNNTKTFPCI